MNIQIDIAQWLRSARKQAGLTQEAAGALVGVGKGNWSAWEKRRHRPSIIQVAQIASELKYPLPEDLSGTPLPKGEVLSDVSNLLQDGESASDQASERGVSSYIQRVPVMGTARLREDGCYEEMEMGVVEGFLRLPTTDGQAHALRVRGDQMAPAIRDGWFVVISPGSAPAVGEYVAVKKKDGTAMVRELLYQRPDSLALMTVNNQMRQSIPMEDIESIYAISAVLGPSQWNPV